MSDRNSSLSPSQAGTAAPAIRAVVIRQEEGQKQTQAFLETLALADLPDHDVLVRVAYSTVNYKDGLALTGGRIARRLPMVAGIDLAGTVLESASPGWKAGDQVIVNGYGLSETQWGGYSTHQRVKSDWLVALPPGFSLQEAMSLGTAGYTAMLCVMALEDAGVAPGEHPVLVTGAAGGVGSIAISLLAALGYRIVASTGRAETHDYLRSLGASECIGRDELNGAPGALSKERWAGVIDCVGGATLANAISQVRYGGCVAACGLAGGSDLPASVFPFILRGVRLQGVDSVMAPMARRVQAWQRLAGLMPREKLAAVTQVVELDEVFEQARRIVAGQTRGRIVVRIGHD